MEEGNVHDPKHREAKPSQGNPSAAVGDLFRLDGRTIIVTGASGFLGTTVAGSILESGGDVVCLDVVDAPKPADWEPIRKAAEKYAGNLTYHQCDVRDAQGITDTFSEFVPSLRYPIRGLVACAGVSDNGPATEFPAESFRRLLDINVTGTFLVAQAVAREVLKSGATASMVLVASMSGYILTSVATQGVDTAGYNSSKAAVHQLARSLAAEWGSRVGMPLVRVNTLSPGYIRTAATAESLQKPGMETQWVGDNMLYRLSTADEFRAPVLFLLGDGSSFMTGADLRLNSPELFSLLQLPGEMERRTENLLKGQARRYQPTSQERSPPPFTKAQLRMFVENYSLAAAKPNSNRLRKLKSTVRDIQNSGKSFDEVQGQLNQVITELDQAFFFSLLRGDVRRDSGRGASDAPIVAPQPLVKLQVQVTSPEQQEAGFLGGERRGGYQREENCIIIYLAEERPPFDKYLATLAHEMIHAYLWIFAHDYSHHGASDSGNLGAHSLEFCRLNLLVLDKLLVWAPESAGLLEARERVVARRTLARATERKAKVKKSKEPSCCVIL
ncbi:putative D-arabinitol 2-dehydrogenase [Seiridium cardinale]|uniref:D-arabinitol 2-dehydrogenase n=1 Tax=Seiridium cardinale TaxID=138064 RepID=A0ABR2XAQ4_9PEZI